MLDTICDSLVAALLPDQARDDAALLVARARALPTERIVCWDLPADPAIVADARARAARQLADWGLEDITFTTELLVSELVTNAIRHAHQPVQLRIILDGALSCEAVDDTAQSCQAAGKRDRLRPQTASRTKNRKHRKAVPEGSLNTSAKTSGKRSRAPGAVGGSRGCRPADSLSRL